MAQNRERLIKMEIQNETRHARGLRLLSAVDGRGGEEVVAKVAAISPDFSRYLVEFAFGDIYARSGLDLKQREIATIAALATLGHGLPQLKVHVAAGLHVGLTRGEILEVIFQMAVYAGFPAALNALFAAQEVFAAEDAKTAKTC